MLEQRKTKWTFPRDTKKEKCIWGWVVNPRAFTLQHSPSPFFSPHSHPRTLLYICQNGVFRCTPERETEKEGRRGVPFFLFWREPLLLPVDRLMYSTTTMLPLHPIFCWISDSEAIFIAFSALACTYRASAEQSGCTHCCWFDGFNVYYCQNVIVKGNCFERIVENAF